MMESVPSFARARAGLSQFRRGLWLTGHFGI